MIHEIRDITIIGGGPAGLFALFYAGMRGASGQIVDALPELGGQLTALYPEKYIFDVGGLPKILAKDLVRALVEQAGQFGSPMHCNQRVVALEEGGGHFTLVTATDRFPTRVHRGRGGHRRVRAAPSSPAVRGPVVRTRHLRPCLRSVRVCRPARGDRRRRRLGVRLGAPAARPCRERRPGAPQRPVPRACVDRGRRAGGGGRGEIALHPFHELHDVIAEDGRLVAVDLKDIKAKSIRRIPADAVLPMLGFVSDIGPLAAWGLRVEQDEILVTSQMETGRPGVYAAGDITTFPGKLKLIATGFGEAATAVNQAVHHVYPEKKVNPGHSSNLAIFGQKEE